ncbi:hypothetical protein I8752_28385 [Nostocaceae cyanobacterium CENA369]|uniref:Uncharacterized protein n=1 Tax=Dendronalium phyllosphericum CENA369 TaxID=1725256 RepID=A0A8J7LI89_9NOST|nr:hypothetical protein [Dendronalium phyllosphericum]MBH8576838.1 hypothetical protein [Dendronalium phyllosphericum CENA369]
MKIDLDWLNRIGIILNFFAGFMLAPDLIGKDKILRFENWLEPKLKIIVSFLKNFIFFSFASAFELQIYKPLRIFLIILISLSLIFVFYIVPKVSIIGDMGIFGTIISILLFIVISMLMLIIFTFFLIIILFGMSRLEHQLEKDDTFLSWLTFWGIVFFIIGNLLQFIASF